MRMWISPDGFLQKQKFYSSFVAHSWNQLNKAGTNSSGNVPWRGLSENQRNLFFSLFSSFDQNKQGVDCCPAVLLKSVSISVTASLGVSVFWHSTRFRGSSAYLSIYRSMVAGYMYAPRQWPCAYLWVLHMARTDKVVYLKGLRTQQFAKWGFVLVYPIVDI